MIIFGSFLPSLLVGSAPPTLLGHRSRHCHGIISPTTGHGRPYNSLKHWGGRRELNPQPSEPQSDALPIELLPPQRMIVQTMIVQTTSIAIAAGVRCLTGAPYGLPMPMYWNPMARRRDESSRFLVSMMIGRFTRYRILAKSSVRNSGQPVATTRASTPSATP